MSTYSRSHLGLYMKFSRFQIAKKERRVNAFKKITLHSDKKFG